MECVQQIIDCKNNDIGHAPNLPSTVKIEK